MTALRQRTVLAERQHVVGDVVALGDVVEHPPDVGRLLVELCAGHAQKRRARLCTAAVQGRWDRMADALARAATKCREIASSGSTLGRPHHSRVGTAGTLDFPGGER